MLFVKLIDDSMEVIKISTAMARWVYESEKAHKELREIARRISIELGIVGRVLEQLRNYSHRITVTDQAFLTDIIKSLNPILYEAHSIIQHVERDRNIIQRLFVNVNEYQLRLTVVTTQLRDLCAIIQRTIPTLEKITIPCREFLDFRNTFKHVSEKELIFYNFSIEDTSNKTLKLSFDKFGATEPLFYIKQDNGKLFLSYQLGAWFAFDLELIVLEQRRKKSAKYSMNSSVCNIIDMDSNLNTISSTRPSPVPEATATLANKTHAKLDFFEFFTSYFDICGIACAQSFTYMATQFKILVIASNGRKIIARHGTKGDGPYQFQHISHIYIPPTDDENLYIVDRGQSAVHHYKINGSGHLFEYVHTYVVIATANQQFNLISCTIYNDNLYVSDDGNNCLHVFPLKKERQAFYLTDNSITPFSPGPICTDGKYLFVANCSVANPGIIVFNDQCQPVDWFRNQLLGEILAVDINPIINELYVLTTTTVIENGKTIKQPMIVSMDSIIR